MLRFFSKTYSTIFAVIFLAATLWNALELSSRELGIVLAAVFVVWMGKQIGKVAVTSEKGFINFGAGLQILLSIIAIVGSIAYYAFQFNQEVAVVLFILLFPLAWWLAKKNPKEKHAHDALEGRSHHVPSFVWIFASAIVLLFSVCLLLVSSSATTEAVRSVWEKVPNTIFWLFGLGSLLLGVLLFRGRERMLAIPLAMLGLFVMLSVALLTFPIGYGFDSFIHQATESHIAEFGTITPKPFYYIGQYSLVLFFHFVFALPIEWIDKLLLPVLAALLVPIAWFASSAHLIREKRTAAATIVALFLLPLGSFIVTTPQGLANLWTLLAILFAIPYLLHREHWPLWPIALSALATALMHPIAGIPILLFLVLVAANPADTRQRFPKLARALSWITIALGAIILPISFAINAWISHQPFSIDAQALSPARLLGALHLEIFLENRFSPLLDFAYLFFYNHTLILVVLAIIGALWWRKSGDANLRPFLAMAFVLFSNYLLMKSALDFSFLIDYERTNYTDRLVPLALFFLSPFLIITAGRVVERLKKNPLVLRISALVLLTALTIVSLYLTYPRVDNYETSHGFNMSSTDIAAVRDVEKEAGGQKYIVLANQTVAASAIREFGFAHYYGELFYYPIPTGGPMYQLFLEMNDHPTRETMQKAMDLANVDLAYYLVNTYWWQAPRIVETAKTNADDWWAIDHAAVHVFQYEREK